MFGAECLYDIRPSVQLPNISGVDSKLVYWLGLVCCRHLSRWCLIHDARLLDLDLWPFQLKIGTSFTHAVGNVSTSFDFSAFFLFELRTCMDR